MPRIAQHSIQEVHEAAAASIVDIIGEFLQLKRKGKDHWAKSPFTNERTPSFSVAPAKGIWKDFSTGKGGGAVSFLMESQGMGYVEAIEHIAARCGIKIEYEDHQPSQEDAQEQTARRALKAAHDLYVAAMTDEAYQYCEGRGIDRAAIERFGIGYAPSGFNWLIERLQKQGHDLQALEFAGLIGKTDSGKPYDRFRSRLLFPIHDHLGRICGFGGRIMGNAQGPKYLNSPETPLYNKSKVLYLLHLTRREANLHGRFILTEGYTDAISLHLHGRGNAIASCGTALTPEQCELMRRTCNEVLVVRDSDAAGINATERDVKVLLKAGMLPKVLPLPNGQDPDSFCRQVGAEGFAQHEARNTRSFTAFLFKMGCKRHGSDATGKSKAVHETLEVIKTIPDSVLMQLSMKELSSLSGLPESSFAKIMRGGNLTEVRGAKPEALATDQMLPHERAALRAVVNDQDEDGVLMQIISELPTTSLSGQFGDVVRWIMENGASAILSSPFCDLAGRYVDTDDSHVQDIEAIARDFQRHHIGILMAECKSRLKTAASDEERDVLATRMDTLRRMLRG